jgi:hypothetical protein
MKVSCKSEKNCTNHPLRHGGCIVHDFLVQIQIVQLLEAFLVHLSNDFMIIFYTFASALASLPMKRACSSNSFRILVASSFLRHSQKSI